ncbi:MAG: hypothetical protein ACJAU4_001437, partial [Glaciecola sp.]
FRCTIHQNDESDKLEVLTIKVTILRIVM